MTEACEALPTVTRTVTARDIVMGAAASRDWQPQHHDEAYARSMNLPGIIMNTPTQTGWFHAYVMDWAGPAARIARWRLRMLRPVCADVSITLSGGILQRQAAEPGFEWLRLFLRMTASENDHSTMEMQLCRPTDGGGTCWEIPSEKWRSPPLVKGTRN